MKNTTSHIFFAALLSCTSISHASSHATAASAALPMAEAEIRKIDLENKKVTLKHGEIKNLDMPGMTMVFQVKDVAMLEKIKTGDMVLFTADKLEGVFTVVTIDKTK